ncbi:hypothetical protein SAMN05443633_101626 [Chryseobacterium arachidis]|uniref:Uncharacterized protein n=2 Tax=Chryseobacterium arachidis TaxID=1416778 RepID=A0A1M4UYB8_9FLAO|nr:hypothetical protein SAMN05443633_101626 [Chryseobacterium arachidis]
MFKESNNKRKDYNLILKESPLTVKESKYQLLAKKKPFRSKGFFSYLL